MDMTNLNGYLVPKMAMKETHRPPVGRIGLQREKFLQENHSLLYDKMLLDGTLYSDLKQTEQRYWEQVEQTITKLLVSNPAPDKNNDPLGWTAHMNSLQAQAAELAMPIVHRRTGADDLIEVIVAFQHQQGTRAGVGQLLGCVADSDDGALPSGAQRRVSAVGAEQAVGPHGTLAHAFQRAAQFRLEDNDRRHKTDGEHVVQQPGHRFQVEHHSQAIRHDDKQDALDQLARAGFARKLQKLVKNKRYNDDIQCIRQRFKCTQTA